MRHWARRGWVSESIKLYYKVYLADAPCHGVCVCMCVQAFRAGDYEEALLYYNRSLSLVPTVAATNNRAQTCTLGLHTLTLSIHI